MIFMDKIYIYKYIFINQFYRLKYLKVTWVNTSVTKGKYIVTVRAQNMSAHKKMKKEETYLAYRLLVQISNRKRQK